MSEFGQSLFSEEEIAAAKAEDEKRKKEYEAKLADGFFGDGKSRRIAFDGIEKEEKVGKTSGKPYVLHTYYLRDVDTEETEKLVDYNFAFTNALDPLKKELGTSLRVGTTVLRMNVTKAGEREFNGLSFPVWGFDLSLLSNDGAKVVTSGKEEKKAEKQEPPF